MSGANSPVKIDGSTDAIGTLERIQNEGVQMKPRHVPHNLTDSYQACVLVCMVRCGLIEALVQVGRESTSLSEAHYAAALLDILLRLADRLLPPKQCTHLHALPTLMLHATEFDVHHRSLRCRASSMLTNLHVVTRSIANTDPLALDDRVSAGFGNPNSNTGGNESSSSKDRRQLQIESLKLKLDMALDVKVVQQKIDESKIPDTKTFSKWNWDVIADLLYGALNNVDHLALCLKAKFFRRLLSFFRPSRKAFVNITWSLENLKYSRVGCQAIEVLLSTKAGSEFLSQHKFFTELIHILQIEVMKDPQAESLRVLTPNAMLRTMSREYFTLVGTLTTSAEGLELMRKVQLWDSLQAIAALTNRDDLGKMLVSSLDYRIDSTAREILSKILTKGTIPVRIHATRHMRVLFRSGKVPDICSWGLQLVARQLDGDPSVQAVAVDVLDEMCTDSIGLEALIRMRPDSLFAIPRAYTILTRFLRNESGFEYLTRKDWIKPALVAWMRHGNALYCQRVEEALRCSFLAASTMEQRSNDPNHSIAESSFGIAAAVPLASGDLHRAEDQHVFLHALEAPVGVVSLPVHFAGELAKTRLGCEMLKSADVIKQAVTLIKSEGASPLQRRAALWMLAHVGSSSNGLNTFIIPMRVIETLIQLSTSCPVLTIRGLACVCIGLICATDTGRELITSAGWEHASAPNMLVALPRQGVERVFAVPPCHFYVSLEQFHFSRHYLFFSFACFQKK